MAHDTARVSPRLHQAHENWEASHDFPRFSDVRLSVLEATRYLTVFEFQPSFVSLLLCAQAHVTKLKSSEFYVGITGCIAATTHVLLWCVQ